MKTFFGCCKLKDENISLKFYILKINNKYGIEILSKGENCITSSVLNITEDENLINKIAIKLYKEKLLPEHLVDVIDQFIE